MIEKELDKFYTKKETVLKCLKKIKFNKYDLVVEPSAGNGSFSNLITHKNLISLDILPQNKNIIKQNWLTYQIPKTFKNVLVIGNPPFGKRNKLSLEFIKHSINFSNVKTIAFILPNVYKKYTLQKKISSSFKLIEILPLKRDSFTLKNNDFCLDTSFFIFEKNSKKKDLRQQKKETTKLFNFSNSNNFDFFCFGAAPHKITKTPNKNNRGYYIKSNINLNKLLSIWKKIKWKGYTSANGGVCWLTKTDIINNFEKFNY